jgi:putative membrane protein
MRIALAALAAISLAACSKPASQTADASQTSAPPPADAAAPPPAPAQADAANTGNAAVKPAHQETSAASAGANSFTEAQAKEHLRNAGYADVTGMSQDSNGVWHGTATKAGKSVPVSVDFKGNISTQ